MQKNAKDIILLSVKKPWNFLSNVLNLLSLWSLLFL